MYENNLTPHVTHKKIHWWNRNPIYNNYSLETVWHKSICFNPCPAGLCQILCRNLCTTLLDFRWRKYPGGVLTTHHPGWTDYGHYDIAHIIYNNTILAISGAWMFYVCMDIPASAHNTNYRHTQHKPLKREKCHVSLQTVRYIDNVRWASGWNKGCPCRPLGYFKRDTYDR